MAVFKLRFDTDNAAFDDGNGQAEIARILRELADKIAGQHGEEGAGRVHDINGNSVGTYGYTLPSRDDE